MKLTVGYIEELLRKFSKGTEVSVGCNNCNHGAIGSEKDVEIIDMTNQTYGYIKLVVNAKNEGEVDSNLDKEEFYTKEVEKLKNEIERLNSIIEVYEDEIETISNIPIRIKRMIDYRNK